MSIAKPSAAPRLSGSVVIAVPDFEPSVGGTNRLAGLLSAELVRRDYDVTVVTRRRSPEWQRSEAIRGVAVRRVGLPGRRALPDKLAALAPVPWLARSSSIAVFHAVMWPDVLFAAASARLLHRTVVTWGASGEATAVLDARRTAAHRAQERLRRRLMRRCVHVALTDGMQQELRGLGLERVEVVPVPVDTSVFRPPSAAERGEARARFALGDGDFVVLYVGHLRALKAIDRLVDAVAMLREGGVQARLLLVGGSRGAADDVEQELRSQVRALALEDSVAFCGVATDPRQFYWATDAFVLPSTQEGMPMTLVEAMAAGVPCVAPPSAGGAELLSDGGGVVPASNAPDELLAALRDLAADPARRAELSRVAVWRAHDHDVRRVTQRYERIYGDLAGGF